MIAFLLTVGIFLSCVIVGSWEEYKNRHTKPNFIDFLFKPER